MHEPWTCGKGLAVNAILPATIGDLLDAMALVLDDHRQALDLSDASARPESDAYTALVDGLRGVARRLAAIGDDMRGYRDLPMGRHDEGRMSTPDAAAVFAAFVQRERALLDLMTRRVREHEAMLASFSGDDIAD